MKFNLRYTLEFYGTVAVPIIYLLVLIAAAHGGTMQAPLLFQLIGVFFLFLGLTFWIISYIQLGRGFGVLPLVQKRVTKGLYSHFRHPMYIGITLTFFGLSLANQSSAGLLSTVLLLLPLLVFRAHLESNMLS